MYITTIKSKYISTSIYPKFYILYMSTHEPNQP